jgi:hypothetical protein
MKTIQTSVKSPQKASRFELLVRLVYWIPVVLVLYILSVLSFLGWILNFGSVLIRGMRSARVSSFLRRVLDYQYKFGAYYSFITDERPPILPE